MLRYLNWAALVVMIVAVIAVAADIQNSKKDPLSTARAPASVEAAVAPAANDSVVQP